MPKVICTLPNASEVISGIRYFKHRLGVISEEIDDKTAKNLATVRGYFIHDPEAPNEGVPDPRPVKPDYRLNRVLHWSFAIPGWR